MWLCTKYGFFSAVCARKGPRSKKIDKTRIMVRARRREHLEMLKGDFTIDAKIHEFDRSDYPFRIFLDKKRFAQLVAELALEIDYDNFKNAVAKLGGSYEYMNFLHGTWHLGLRMEPEIKGRSGRPFHGID